jgi:hypothetical protein
MQASALGSVVVVGLLALASAGALATLLVNGALGRLAALAVLAVVLVSVVAASALGSRSRRWLSNPYW